MKELSKELNMENFKLILTSTFVTGMLSLKLIVYRKQNSSRQNICILFTNHIVRK